MPNSSATTDSRRPVRMEGDKSVLLLINEVINPPIKQLIINVRQMAILKFLVRIANTSCDPSSLQLINPIPAKNRISNKQAAIPIIRPVITDKKFRKRYREECSCILLISSFLSNPLPLRQIQVQLWRPAQTYFRVRIITR